VIGGFLNELRRRNVFRIVAGYLAVAWVTFEVVQGVESAAGFPAWADSVALIILVAAFPVVVFVAWTFELTPEGIKATRRLNASEADALPPPRLADFAIMGAIVLFAGLLAWQPISNTIRTGAPPLARNDGEVNIVTPAGGESGSVESQIATAIPNELSVAVLPFLPFTDDQSDAYFADGLTEEILNSLAALPDLRVTSRTSAFQFRGRDLPSIPEIAASLGVAHVMEGSVRRSGEQVRITVQLIRASDDVHLWSQTYDRTMEDVFEIQEDIAENVAAVLNVVLSEDNRRQMRNSGTRNIDAFIAFQQGKSLWDRAHEEEDTNRFLEQADAHFARATELAPDFSEAYLLQSDWYGHLLSDGTLADDAEAREQARARHGELLQLAYDSASDDTRRAIVAVNEILFSEDWTYARQTLEQAITSDICAHDNWTQDFAYLYGNMDQRLAYAERLVECDPLNPMIRLFYGNTLIVRGDYEAALDWAADLTERGMDYEAEVIGFDALLGLGRLGDAEAMLQPHWEWESLRLAARRGGDTAREVLTPFLSEDAVWFNLILLTWIGDTEAANAVAAEIDARPYGYLDLMTAIDSCRCGAPFDRNAVPGFSRRLAQANFEWPPRGDLGFPRTPLSPAEGTEN
jgi:TolB-like protein